MPGDWRNRRQHNQQCRPRPLRFRCDFRSTFAPSLLCFHLAGDNRTQGKADGTRRDRTRPGQRREPGKRERRRRDELTATRMVDAGQPCRNRRATGKPPHQLAATPRKDNGLRPVFIREAEPPFYFLQEIRQCEHHATEERKPRAAYGKSASRLIHPKHKRLSPRSSENLPQG